MFSFMIRVFWQRNDDTRVMKGRSAAKIKFIMRHYENTNIDLFIYLFICLSQTQKRPYMHTHAKKRKKKKKRNINPKRCTIEKYKFKTKLAQSIGNKTIYTTSAMTLMT